MDESHKEKRNIGVRNILYLHDNVEYCTFHVYMYLLFMAKYNPRNITSDGCLPRSNQLNSFMSTYISLCKTAYITYYYVQQDHQRP